MTYSSSKLLRIFFLKRRIISTLFWAQIQSFPIPLLFQSYQSIKKQTSIFCYLSIKTLTNLLRCWGVLPTARFKKFRWFYTHLNFTDLSVSSYRKLTWSLLHYRSFWSSLHFTSFCKRYISSHYYSTLSQHFIPELSNPLSTLIHSSMLYFIPCQNRFCSCRKLTAA